MNRYTKYVAAVLGRAELPPGFRLDPELGYREALAATIAAVIKIPDPRIALKPAMSALLRSHNAVDRIETLKDLCGPSSTEEDIEFLWEDALDLLDFELCEGRWSHRIALA